MALFGLLLLCYSDPWVAFHVGVNHEFNVLLSTLAIADTALQVGADSSADDDDGAFELRRASQGCLACDAVRSGGQQQVRSGERSVEAEERGGS